MSPSQFERWQQISAYLKEPAAAAAAIIPPYYGMIAKSALQCQERLPRMSPSALLKQSLQASPVVGATVGTQLLVQQLFEDILTRNTSKPESSTSTVLLSTSAVALISVPALAVVNGQTMGWTPVEALRRLNVRQGGAIVGRELSFLLGIRAAAPACEGLKERYGEHKIVGVAGAFFSGMAGSLVGHPADSLLTWAQKGVKQQSWKLLMRGGLTKGVTVGVFAVLYEEAKRALSLN